MKPKIVKLPDAGFMTLQAILSVFPVGEGEWKTGVRTGLYPAPVKIASRTKAYRAREIRALLESVENGEGTSVARKPGPVTFEQVARQWVAKRERESLSQRSVHDILRRFTIHVFPYIGTLPVNAISPQHIIPLLQRAERTSSPTI